MSSSHEHEQSPDASPASLIERMTAVYAETGFFPHTNRELSIAKSALEVQDKPGGFAVYLNKVLLHQIKSNSEKPTKAVLTIDKEVAHFAHDAFAARSFTDELQDEFDESHPFVTLDQVFGDNWVNQSSTKRALGDLNRRHVINGMLNGEIDLKKIDEVNSIESINDMMTSMAVHEAEKLVEQIREEELERELFWKKQDAAAQNHMLISGKVRS